MTDPRRTRFVAALAALSLTTQASAQGGLQVSGNRAQYGIRALRAGFATQPVGMRLGAERTVDAAQRRLGPTCAGIVTVVPDYIVRVTGTLPLLRVFVRASDDTTLLVNTADGRWLCSDDWNGGRDPLVDIVNASAGQYDIWVGRRASSTGVRATLTITDSAARRP